MISISPSLGIDAAPKKKLAPNKPMEVYNYPNITHEIEYFDLA